MRRGLVELAPTTRTAGSTIAYAPEPAGEGGAPRRRDESCIGISQNSAREAAIEGCVAGSRRGAESDGKSAGPTLARRPKRPEFIQIEINCSFLLEHFGHFCFNRSRMPGATATVSDASAEFSPGASLSAIEVEVIDLFVSVMRLIGLPRSLGEIYGLLFISTLPLTLDDLVSRLQISKGSASQGPKTLRQIGAVKVTYVPGDRRDHFIAETELKRLAAGFIRPDAAPPRDREGPAGADA